MAKTGRPQVPRRTVQCAGCGVDVKRRESDLARNKTGRAFCSKACRDSVGCKPRTGRTVKCQNCGTQMYERRGEERKYCGKLCHDAAQRTDRVEVACQTCGASILVRPSQAARRFCNRECYESRPLPTAIGRMHNGKPVRRNWAGYLMVFEPDHPNAYKNGWVLEHRLVAEGILGRYLDSSEEVHHKNRVKTDNSPENLVVLSGEDHGQITALDNWRDLKQMKELLARYRDLYGDLDEGDTDSGIPELQPR